MSIKRFEDFENLHYTIEGFKPYQIKWLINKDRELAEGSILDVIDETGWSLVLKSGTTIPKKRFTIGVDYEII